MLFLHVWRSPIEHHGRLTVFISSVPLEFQEPCNGDYDGDTFVFEDNGDYDGDTFFVEDLQENINQNDGIASDKTSRAEDGTPTE